MSVDVVLASKNPKKRQELAAILAEAAPRVRIVDAEWPDVAETGASFADNAVLKARAAHEATGLLGLADDSGLEVAALGGEPGVRSARYAGAHGDDRANNEVLLERMHEVENRRCRFRCVVAIVGAGIELTVEGSVDGNLRREPSGTSGFGYDPLFEPLGWDKTFAEGTAAEKGAISHRGKALRAAARVLATLDGP